MSAEHWQNDIDRAQLEYSEINRTNAILSTTNPTWTGLELN